MLRDLGACTLREVADARIDAVLAYFQGHRSCAEWWFAERDGTLDALFRSFDQAQAGRLRHHLVERNLIVADTPRDIPQVAFGVGNRYLDMAFRRSPDDDDVTIDEGRRRLTGVRQAYHRVRRAGTDF
ncbi:hypothetical protein [Streptomyces griseoluteus]|uniref:hypothetical protein n=1 Tax=Streptomyces griseoluteus TaxID=29306 RepID=UPI0036FEF74E